MKQIALLSATHAPGLGPDAEAALGTIIEAAGGKPSPYRWLSPGHALEAEVEGNPSLTKAREMLGEMLGEKMGGIPADINFIPADGRRKALMIADMDSTIISSESLDDLARLAGKGDEVATITARSMRGELDFSQSLKARVGMLAGSPTSLIDTIIAEAECNPGATELVTTLRRHGVRTVLASGGFTFLTEVIVGRLGFDAHFANTLVVRDGVITGEVTDPVLDQHSKRTILDREIEALGITPDDVATIGDGANDRGMTERAGMGVAYQGKDALKAVTPYWLDHTDLRGMLWLQGYDDSMITRS